MPYCWFHGNPSSGDCFIGFEDASMPLTQWSNIGPYTDYEDWLTWVGIYLAVDHDTVIEALDDATDHCWSGYEYEDTELDDGFTAYWPYGNGTGRMKVYGNWNINVY
jgi:hypothetical protein